MHALDLERSVTSRKAAAFCLVLPLFLLGLFVARPAAAQDSKVCLTCHGQTDLSTTDSSGAEHSLYIRAAQLDSSSHASLSCVDCHAALAGVDEGGHDTPVPQVDCST
ncbi:hypothetical protein LLH00_18725, partial [bacterium]|nr:hypothetical protein [bacterium]